MSKQPKQQQRAGKDSETSRGKRKEREPETQKVFVDFPNKAFYVVDKRRVLFADNDIIACIRFMKSQDSYSAKVYRLEDDLLMAYRSSNTKRIVLNTGEIEKDKATKMN